MKTWHKIPLFSSLFLTSSIALAAMSPQGLWATFDERTHEKRAIIRVAEENNKLTTTIVQVFKKPGDTGICSKCPGQFKDKPVLGLTFGWGFVPTGNNSWGEGHILDPKTGKIYKANMKLKDEDHLALRGYIGVSLLGRTQVWKRES